VNTLVRFVRFNLVGAMGMVVQLGTLALLDRWMPAHYLYASAASVEISLLHNFAWHSRYTWRDREIGLSSLFRFHLSAGLISIAGNVAMMALLVQWEHSPVLVANVIAIVCCSVVNFGLVNRWAFAGSEHAEQKLGGRAEALAPRRG
jgi:putative flippase GtrA